ncbi:probable polypeptide N-acetylgalactosaminyltransferase 8 isoform X2 [Phyllopteryx taeniolatus]|uniref:probable polypeptide N-acetylgalactosaminyltransferase 8 isoform X2 n=1 Tax=Phyllopteryx taeniolatus TaxID=161469 RepID=UPI002AD4C98B|nr:probable polypeptide N-acetylgalactosaminyltransferase 8 isoform X2 [Phyllopteryx taeniolatus]
MLRTFSPQEEGKDEPGLKAKDHSLLPSVAPSDAVDMRPAGRLRVVLLAAMVASILLYLASTRGNSQSPSESVQGWGIFKRMENMEANIERLLDAVDKLQPKPAAAVRVKAEDEPAVRKVFPNSALFKKWGEGLSEDEQKEAEGLFAKYGYNAFLSDRLPLNREIPDTRHARCVGKKYPADLPSLSVVLIYLDEALSIIKRAVRSIVDKTPAALLREIILVDDHSANDDLKEKLDDYIAVIHEERPGLLKRVVHRERLGLTRARLSGWKMATGDAVAILDAHIEVHVQWAEPLLARLKEDRTIILTPVFDRVNYDDLTVTRYGPAADAFDWALWCMYESFRPEWYRLKDESLPAKSPSIMGILVADRKFFGEIGSLDAGMKIYGGENVELGIRAWLCGGSVEVIPCSKIAHIERARKPYLPDLSVTMRRNALRVAEVWMDEYKHNVNIAWNLPLQLINQLKPDLCIDQGPVPGSTPILYSCHHFDPQRCYYRTNGQLYVGGIKSHTYNSNRCLVDPGSGVYPALYECKLAEQKKFHMLWDFKQGTSIQNRETKRCLEIAQGQDSYYQLIVQRCTGQIWNIQNYIPNREAQG